MKRTLILIALLCLFVVVSVRSQQAPPCTDGKKLTWQASTQNWVCTDAVNTNGGGDPLPSGAIVMIASGSCPSGYTEATELNGKMPLGTLVANSNVGTTGGTDNITPAGTNSAPTFTGDSFNGVINHTHTVNVNDPGHTHLTQRYPTATGGNSGFTIDTSMSGTLANNTLPTASGTTGITASSVNPAGGVSSITPTGTVTAPTFTGTQFDNRSAFVRVIFCKKN